MPPIQLVHTEAFNFDIVLNLFSLQDLFPHYLGSVYCPCPCPWKWLTVILQARIQAPGNTDMKLDSQYLIEVQIRSCEETQLYDHIKDHIKMRSREENIKMTIDQHQICMLFLAVQNSSTCHWLTQSLSQYFYFWHTKSDPKNLWHLTRVMRKHDLSNICCCWKVRKNYNFLTILIIFKFVYYF